jgi:hypothetical protein
MYETNKNLKYETWILGTNLKVYIKYKIKFKIKNYIEFYSQNQTFKKLYLNFELKTILELW